MFSIIIPLYNKALYIEKALSSVFSQTYKAFEVIVVNDGSTDCSLEVAQQFHNSTISQLNNSKIQNLTIVSQKNQGVSTARNNGVKLAQYPYICFLDADDWWEPTFLEEMKSLIEAYPQAGIYGSSYFKVKNGQYIPANIGVDKGFVKGLINYYKVYAKTLWMPLWTGAVIMPKQVYQALDGFKPALKLGEDFDLWVRIALKYPVAFLNKPLAYYNQDVELQNRAVGNKKFYKPEEHMLFTDYGAMMENKDFRYLYERLALYGLLHYYLNGVNKKETYEILEKIELVKHERKYFFYYKLPVFIVRIYFGLLLLGSKIKQQLILAI